MKERWLVRIYGVVQGVGFRPYIYNLAKKNGISGIVGNDTKGVFVEIEGNPETLENFLSQISVGAPPMARIEKILIQTRSLEIKNRNEFEIVDSQESGEKHVVIPVDMSICAECENELLDPGDRRYLYPFINCTNCGPRYTIIENLPYDRKNTTMKEFSMCKNCEKEYIDPANRRFHAQPNACWDCGPQVYLFNNNRELLADGAKAIKIAGKLLKQGYILAIKGIGGYHLACDACNNQSVINLRNRKYREKKALAIMAKDINVLSRIVKLSSEAIMILKGPEKPILLLPKKENNILADEIAPTNPNYGVMLPYTPLHRALFEFAPPYLVMTSGNRVDEPIVFNNEDAFQRLSNIADYFLIHNRDIKRRCDDSVATLLRNKLYMIRRSRGFSPSAIKLPSDFDNVLAVGSEQKNTIAITEGKNIIISHHLGDLENVEAYHAFCECITDLQDFIGKRPNLIVHDLHPEYLSTKWAYEQKTLRIAIQHHEAHIGACMLENNLTDPVIGFAFDGTGYGTDGNIWGSEVLVGDGKNFQRLSHILPIPLLGGEKAIKEIWRIGFSIQEIANLQPAIFSEENKPEINVLRKMISQEINVFYSTGMGRLFDGFSAFLGLNERVSYDGQAAIELENLAHLCTSPAESLFFDIIFEGNKWIWDWRPLFRKAHSLLQDGITKAELARAFHDAIARSVTEVAILIRDRYYINKVCLSGGVFMNKILVTECINRLEQANFEVYYHNQIPCNDGGIAAGQIYLAYLRRKK